MVPNSELTVPVNHDKSRTVLGRRGDELRWFTPLGFKNMPAIYTKDKDGKPAKIPNDGWTQVDPDAFRKAPEPVTAAQVVSPQAPEVKKTAAADAVPPVDPTAPPANEADPGNQTAPGKDKGGKKQ